MAVLVVVVNQVTTNLLHLVIIQIKLEMWANAQRDGYPAEYRWRPLFNTAKFGWRPLLVPCSDAAKMRNPLKFAGVPHTNETR